MKKPLSRTVFTAIRVCHYQAGGGAALTQRMLHSFAIVIITSGQGLVQYNGVDVQLAKGQACLLVPGTMVSGQCDAYDPVYYTLIQFRCVRFAKVMGQWQAIEPGAEAEDLPIVQNYAPIADCVEPFLAYDGANKSSSRSGLHWRLERLLEAWGKEKRTDRQLAERQESGMERALAYLQAHYTEEITVEQLAGQAGFSANHFTKLFRQRMNLTPSQYLAEQRMRLAKQLIANNVQIKAVAQQVGYRDEHYFSRVFKKWEGVAPSVYIRQKCQRIAALYYGVDDLLVTLGIDPVASMSYGERVTHLTSAASSGRCAAPATAVAGLSSFSPNYDRLRKLQPDLMITSSRLEHDDALPLIAPTMVLQHSDRCDQMLTQVGELLGRERQAARWIEQYEAHAAMLREKLLARWGQATACFIRIRSGYYRVYGSSNQTGNLLHEELGLALPNVIPAQTWAIDVQLEELGNFNADHYFVMLDPNEQSRQQLDHLLHSEQSASLRAIRKRHVYDASDLLFAALGPTGRLSAMNRIAGQLGVQEQGNVHPK